MNQPELIVIGASARAAAFSAARAGYSPWWIDQFGDSDLRAAFPGRCVPPEHYPRGILQWLDAAPQAPWLYTGALENHVDLLDRIAAVRPLLGNGREVCERVRNPWLLQSCLRDAGIPFPETPPFDSAHGPGDDWIVKPLRSAGGLGIRPAGAAGDPAAGFYLQRIVGGASCSAVFVANGVAATLIGVTQQLIGMPEFHAAAFSYCGSIGPVTLAGDERQQWQKIGTILTTEFKLKGIFGVDAIRATDGITPLEVNPRYTASVEVIEHVLAISAIRLHVEACAGSPVRHLAGDPGMCIGKAYLFAPRDMEFFNMLPVQTGSVVDAGIQFADIPEAGTHIAMGAPILSLLVRAGTPEACADLLCTHARRIYNRLGV